MQSSNGGKKRTIQQIPAHRSRKAKLECVSRQVAQRKGTDEALRQSEVRYRQLFEGVGDAVMVYGLNGRFLDCNKVTLERLGYSYDEFLNLTAADIVHPDFHATMRDNQKKIWTGQATVVESAHRCKDGRVIPVEVNACRIEYDGQQAILAVVRDITARKRAEKQVEAERQRLYDVLETLPVMVCLLTPDYHITFANRVFRQKFGEDNGRYCYDYIFGRKGPCEFCEAYNVLKTGKPHHWECTSPDGCSIIDVYDFPFTDTDGSPLILEMDIDITERKCAEETLRSSENKYRTLVENLPQKIFLKDKNSVYISCNENYARDLKITPAHIVGKTDYDFYPKELAEKYRADDKRAMEEDKTEEFEEEYLREGEKRWVHTVKTPVKEPHGNLIGILGIFWDITERRKAEQKLLEYQKELRSLASQLTLAEERERHRIATELHDQMGQSLTISKIRVDALHQSMKTGEHAKVLEEVCNCLSKAIAQTRSLTFDLSSPILHQLGFEAAVAAWLTEQIEAKHHVSTIFEDDRQAKPLDDDVRTILFRNVRELLINVVKHAKAHKVRVSVRKIGNQIQVDVQDDGVGFDPTEALAEAARKDKFGLFSVKERLEQIGGRFQIESEPGHGCIVTMTAPLKKEGEINDGRI